MTTTENYGLKKPESNDYVSIDVINENMDVVDEKLKENADHSSNASNPHKVTAAQTGAVPALLASDLLVKLDVPTLLQWDANTANTPYKAGLTQCEKGFALGYGDYKADKTTIAWALGGAKQYIWMHTVREGVSSGWVDMTAFLPLTGGTLMDILKIKRSSYPSIQMIPTDSEAGRVELIANNNSMSFTASDSSASSADGRGLAIYNHTALTDKKNAFRVFDRVESTSTFYSLLGEHNKTKGTYTGNGSSTTTRSFGTYGIGYILLVQSDNGTALVTPKGAIVINGTTFTWLTSSEVYFEGGILKITSTNKVLNQLNTTYTYYVI